MDFRNSNFGKTVTKVHEKNLFIILKKCINLNNAQKVKAQEERKMRATYDYHYHSYIINTLLF